MKTKFLLIGLISFLVILGKDLFAISDNFQFVIDEIGVPRYNVLGKEINEDIYNVYNMFIYGNPVQVKNCEQRWKSFANGKWCYGGGVYNGKGTRGEYLILGYDYSGNIVYNYYFPLDKVPPTPILKWQFLNVNNALKSWINAEQNYSVEQVHYMKNANWWFQDISDKQNNPYNQIEYDLTALKVGLNKVRLETAATWKTRGSVYVERRTETGGIGFAIFMIQPMSANARVESNLECNLENTLKETEDTLLISISFGSELKDLSEYAKEKHIKDITSILYYNDKEVARVSGSKITSVGNTYMLVISRDNIPQNKTYLFNLKVRSYVKTEFSADGLLQDEKSITVKVNVEPQKIIPFLESKIKILTKKEENWVVSPLAQTLNTKLFKSLGFTEAGRVVLIKNIINKETVKYEDISNVKIYIDKIELNKVSTYQTNKNDMIIKVELPLDLPTTLYGWKSLRQLEQNYFKIDLNKILTRCKKPHKLELEYFINEQRYVQEFLFDTLDDYISNMNNNIINSLIITKTGNEQLVTEFIEETYE